MEEFIKDPERVSIVAILFAVLGTGFKRIWVWGYQLVEMTADRDFWRKTALSLMKVTEKQAGVDPDAD